MATPTVEAASAGASLTPSPTMTVCPCLTLIFLTCSTLSSGSKSPYTSSTPAAFATALAVPLRSPVSITVCTPSSRSLAMAAMAWGRIVSCRAISPTYLSSCKIRETVLPSATNTFNRCINAAGISASFSSALPIRHSCPSTWASIPQPVMDFISSTFFSFMPSAPALLTIAWASGCSDRLSAEAQAASTSKRS
ncbi:hypothetical protein D3C77_350440 [compost metagenome]